MNVTHHPDDDLLLAYAAGNLDMAMSLLLATHVTFCGRCRARAAAAEQVGGTLLERLAPAPLSPDALDRKLARLARQEGPTAPPASNDNTPLPLRDFLGRDLSSLRWRRLGPRLGYVTLMRRGPLTMRLLRGAPGTDTGSHSHQGMEYTLVLRGGYRDETGQYGPGDFQTASGDMNHNPVANLDGDCINLAVTTAPLHFDGALQKLVGRLFGF